MQSSLSSGASPEWEQARPLNGRTQVKHLAKVAESVDALVLGTSGATRESSSLSFRTMSLT